MELAIDTGRLDVTHSKAVLSMSLHFQNLVRVVVKSTTDSIFDTLCRSACCEPAVLDLNVPRQHTKKKEAFSTYALLNTIDDIVEFLLTKFLTYLHAK